MSIVAVAMVCLFVGRCSREQIPAFCRCAQQAFALQQQIHGLAALLSDEVLPENLPCNLENMLADVIQDQPLRFLFRKGPIVRRLFTSVEPSGKITFCKNSSAALWYPSPTPLYCLMPE
jgi:hypothetical protein